MTGYHQTKKIKKTCRYCGGMFISTERSKQQYCSPDCQGKAKKHTVMANNGLTEQIATNPNVVAECVDFHCLKRKGRVCTVFLDPLFFWRDGKTCWGMCVSRDEINNIEDAVLRYAKTRPLSEIREANKPLKE